MMPVSFDYTDVEGGTADGDAGLFGTSLASSVDGNEEVVAAATDFECHFPIIPYDDGTDIETVRCNRSDGDGA